MSIAATILLSILGVIVVFYVGVVAATCRFISSFVHFSLTGEKDALFTAFQEHVHKLAAEERSRTQA